LERGGRGDKEAEEEDITVTLRGVTLGMCEGGPCWPCRIPTRALNLIFWTKSSEHFLAGCPLVSASTEQTELPGEDPDPVQIGWSSVWQWVLSFSLAGKTHLGWLSPLPPGFPPGEFMTGAFAGYASRLQCDQQLSSGILH
jgi:hypothetical protein